MATVRAVARRRNPLKRKSTVRPLTIGRRVLADEARAVAEAGERLNGAFTKATHLIAACEGRLVVTGMGKANFVSQKISATFASTGTPSLFLHPADALHGDLGRLTPADVVLALSHSGETEEMLRLIPAVKQVGATVIAMTASKRSSLARGADLTIEMGRWDEAGTGLAPTTSTTVMLALGDALAMVVLELRGFTEDEFKQFHPAGSLGRRLMLVEDVMRGGEMLPCVKPKATIAEVISVMTSTPGRPGAATVIGPYKKLVGMFTDGDLRRLMESGTCDLAAPISSVMSTSPKTITPDQRVAEAAAVMRAHHVDQVAVVDTKHRPVGLLDVQDLLALGLF